MSDESEEMRRLKWRCRRGLLELDILFQRFLENRYSSLSTSRRQAFSDLLELPDTTLLAYVNQQEQPDDLRLRNAIRELIE